MMINKLNLYEDRTPRIMIKSQTGVSYTHHATPNYHTSREFMKTVRTTRITLTMLMKAMQTQN